MIKLNNNPSSCCGCTACMSICPKNAITMKKNAEGFLYPMIDKKKCINCGLCKKVCPYENNNNKMDVIKTLVVQNKSDKILETSTSGGFFSSLASYVIKKGGYVCGAIFDKENNVYHKLTNNIEEITKFRESKYVQSDLKNTYIETKKILDMGVMVCFSGTPCQIVGLKNYLRKDYQNLITVDFVCRSVPSPLLFDEYKKYQESKYNSKIKEFHFRKKTYGYHSGTVRIVFENGKVYNGSNRVDIYNKLFHSNKCSRQSCYNCIAKGFNRPSDFTVFDSWYPNKLNSNIVDNDKGYSNLIVRSKKGLEIINSLQDNFYLYEIDINEANKYTGEMLCNSIEKPKDRDNFYEDLIHKGLKKTYKKYIKVSLTDKMFEKSKYILYKYKILGKIKKLKSK